MTNYDKEANILCPNCGGTLAHSRFVSVCEFCGTVMEGNLHPIVPQDSPSINMAKHHLDYLHDNIDSIRQSPFLREIKAHQGSYGITSLPFYGCDKYCRKVTYPSFHFRYENDGENEKLLFGIRGNRPATRMILLLNKDIISLPLQDQDSQTSWFRLSIEQLLQICTTQEIDMNTDLETEDSIQYHELSAFASRFYNVVFNRLKFLYSVNIQLITDP